MCPPTRDNSGGRSGCRAEVDTSSIGTAGAYVQLACLALSSPVGVGVCILGF